MTTPGDPGSTPVASPGADNGTFLRNVAPALVWTIVIFVAGGIPNPGPSVPLFLSSDKLKHAVAFAILQVLALRALRYEMPRAFPRSMPWIAAVLSSVAGGLLELFQLTVPNRSAELLDVAANTIGIVTATLVTLRLKL